MITCEPVAHRYVQRRFLAAGYATSSVLSRSEYLHPNQPSTFNSNHLLQGMLQLQRYFPNHAPQNDARVVKIEWSAASVCKRSDTSVQHNRQLASYAASWKAIIQVRTAQRPDTVSVWVEVLFASLAKVVAHLHTYSVQRHLGAQHV